jgi:2-polyprenyl-6-methoxyphenol hydroxylase-like FAD-dependent oxidoreductase
MAHEGLRRFWDNQPAGYWVPFNMDSRFFLITYECRNREELNLAIRQATLPKHQTNDGWNTPATVEDITSAFKEVHPMLNDLIRISGDFSVHKLLRREPLASYTRGRAVIIGDAAHPFPPTHGKTEQSTNAI